MILEFNVDAVHEDEAAATAEEIVWNDSHGLTSVLTKHYRIPNVGVRCIEVNEYEE